MSVSAYLATERKVFIRGMPSISTSTSAVMRASTSSGVMPGALRIILTWVDDTSGKASIGVSCKARQPAPASSNATSSISSRWVSENWMIEGSIIPLLPARRP